MVIPRSASVCPIFSCRAGGREGSPLSSQAVNPCSAANLIWSRMIRARQVSEHAVVRTKAKVELGRARRPTGLRRRCRAPVRRRQARMRREKCVAAWKVGSSVEGKALVVVTSRLASKGKGEHRTGSS